MYIHVHTCTYIHVHTCTYMYLCMYIHVLHNHIHVHTCTYIHVHTCTYMYIHVHTCTSCTCTYACTYMHVHLSVIVRTFLAIYYVSRKHCRVWWEPEFLTCLTHIYLKLIWLHFYHDWLQSWLFTSCPWLLIKMQICATMLTHEWKWFYTLSLLWEGHSTVGVLVQDTLP